MADNVSNIIEYDLTGVGKYSFSRLSTYETCQYQYDQHYNKKADGVDNTFALFGTMGHSILEGYLKKEIPLEDVESEYDRRFLEECSDGIVMFSPKKDGTFFERDLTELYYNGGHQYFSDFDGFEGLNVLGVEENFDILIRYNDERFIFNGFIDLVAEKDGELLVIDHKSKGKFKSIAEKNRYKRQLVLYSIYAEYKYGIKVREVWFNQFRINHIEKFSITDSDIKEALDWATKIIKNINNEFLWLPNTSDRFYCRNLCDIREDCPYFEVDWEG